MDDFGNCYQTLEWMLYAEEVAYSTSAYGGEGVVWLIDWATIDV